MSKESGKHERDVVDVLKVKSWAVGISASFSPLLQAELYWMLPIINLAVVATKFGGNSIWQKPQSLSKILVQFK